MLVLSISLNPYFCGRWFLWIGGVSPSAIEAVLILISVEDGFCVLKKYSLTKVDTGS